MSDQIFLFWYMMRIRKTGVWPIVCVIPEATRNMTGICCDGYVYHTFCYVNTLSC